VGLSALTTNEVGDYGQAGSSGVSLNFVMDFAGAGDGLTLNPEIRQFSVRFAGTLDYVDPTLEFLCSPMTEEAQTVYFKDGATQLALRLMSFNGVTNTSHIGPFGGFSFLEANGGGASSVPIPASWLLLAGALGLLRIMRQRNA
jgi:hypothetical protein